MLEDIPVLRDIAPFTERRIDPLDCRLDLAPVTGTPGAFQYLAHVDQGV